MLLAAGTTLYSAEFHVALNGKDSNPGTEKKPFATLLPARDAIRALPEEARGKVMQFDLKAYGIKTFDPLNVAGKAADSQFHFNIPKANSYQLNMMNFRPAVEQEKTLQARGISVDSLHSCGGATYLPRQIHQNQAPPTMKTYPRKVILAATGLLLLPLTSHAAITIAYYDFATVTGATTTGANNTATTVTGSGWTPNNTSHGRSTGNGPDGNAGHYFGRGPKDTAATSYIQFGVTAINSTTLDLSSLSFDYWMGGIRTQEPASASFTFEVRSSLDSYEAAIPGTYSLNPITKAESGDFHTASFDLTDSSFQDLSTITFRLYVTGNVAGNTDNIARFDDIQLQVIPEPTTALLGSLGLLALLRRRRA